MSKFSQAIHPYVQAELQAALDAEAHGQPSAAFTHLESAHVLGQASTVHHVRVHWRMFLWGLRQRDMRECLGQLLRLGGAATKTALGLVPYGNTGGCNVSPFRRMPVAADLETVIQDARRQSVDSALPP